MLSSLLRSALGKYFHGVTPSGTRDPTTLTLWLLENMFFTRDNDFVCFLVLAAVCCLTSAGKVGVCVYVYVCVCVCVFSSL